jgi:hypothetical protein
MRSRTSQADRREAVRRAAVAWCDRYESQVKAAKAAREKGVALSQPMLGQYMKGKKIGEAAVDLLSELFEVSHDGLVRLFLGGKSAMALKDVTGWKRAKEEAQEELHTRIDGWVWRVIDDVVVPVALKRADKQMVKEIAQFLNYWGATSSVRPLARTATK